MFFKQSAKRLSLVLGFLLVATPAAFADLFNVTINTTSLSGTSGGIYMVFSTPLDTSSNTVSVDSFAITGPGSILDTDLSGGAFPPGPVSPGAGVTGMLDAAPVVFTNVAAANDFIQYLNFGTSLSFRVNFNLPVQNGSVFDFGLTATDGLTSLLSTDPNNPYIGEIAVSDTGVFGTTAFNASAVTITPVTTPEPTSLFFLGAAAGICLLRLRKRSLQS